VAGLTDDGYEARRGSDILTLMQDEYKSLVGLESDFEFDLFTQNLFVVVANQLGLLEEGLEAVYDSRDPNNATGVTLSNLATITGADRRIATFGTVEVDLTGDADAVIPGGTTTYEGGGDDGTAKWIQRDDVTLDGLGVASDVLCDAEEAGAVTAAPGEVTAIVTATTGLDTVTNPASAVAGAERETDLELRARRLETLQLGASAAAAALQAELLTIEEITGAFVVENESGVPIIFEGVTVAAHALAPIVHPATISAAVKQEVADRTYRTVCGGIGTSGTEAALVQGADLAPKTIRFSLSTTRAVNVVYDVTRETGLDVPDISEIDTELTALTLDFFAALNLGEDVLVIDLLCIAQPVEGIRTVAITLTVPTDPTRIDAGGNAVIFVSELGVPGTITVNEV
jgi:uncharacterized phage protein gp47/JayE